MFEPTGEVRLPRCGELYLSTDGRIELATFDFDKVITPIYRHVNNATPRRSQRIKNKMQK